MNRRRFLSMACGAAAAAAFPHPPSSTRTEITIDADQFRINGHLTYAGRHDRGASIEGLLMNARMVQAIFDDLNPQTRTRWNYPDTHRWDPERNTREFIAAMPAWRGHGLLSFTLNLQGGTPETGAREHPWENSAFAADGSLRASPELLARPSGHFSLAEFSSRRGVSMAYPETITARARCSRSTRDRLAARNSFSVSVNSAW